MKRQVFYSFHYVPDNWRVSQIRNIGTIEGNKAASDNTWEEVKQGSDKAIQKWIADNMNYRTCTIVLIGANTAGRKWIGYEIKKSWDDGKGLVGIHIHNLKDSAQNNTTIGANPFSRFTIGGKAMDQIIKCYNPPSTDSKEVYNWISNNIVAMIDEAIKIRKEH